MSEISRSDLLDFLQKPQYLTDIARGFRISPRLARYRLRDALQSGQVLVSDERVSWKHLGKSFKTSRITDYLHISRQSPLLKEGLTTPKHRIPAVKFVSNPVSLVGRTPSSTTPKVWLMPLRSNTLRHLVKNTKGQPADRRSAAGVWWRKPMKRAGKPPSHLTLHGLLKGLSKEGLTQTEIQQRFNVSKQSVKRLVNNGILLEDWGAKGIGVRYKLSKKGQDQLTAMQQVSRIASPRETFIPLKSYLSNKHL